MPRKTNLANLPPEIRHEIFSNYFQVEGGYVCDGDRLHTADGAPIDLSLRYTCRSIANDTKHLPLAANIIKFTTIHRKEWRSLGGCLNLASSCYFVLLQAFVFHLAQYIPHESWPLIDLKCPAFRRKLQRAEASHQILMHDDDGDNAEDETQPCPFVSRHFWAHVGAVEKYSLLHYTDYGCIYRHPDHRFPIHKLWGAAEDLFEVQAALSFCLRLIAETNPAEFTSHVYAALPHWAGRYSANDFFNLKFDHWTIPSQSEVAHVIKLLGIGDFVWELPDMWSYEPPSFYYQGSESSRPRRYLTIEDVRQADPGRHLSQRGREKVRFSATAIAIRFLKRLPANQRTRVRKLILHEDFPSVNVPSVHARGLIPFLRENPLLRVERRVSVLGCAADIIGWLRPDVLGLEREHNFKGIDNCDLKKRLSSWLLDALVMADLNLPPKSFTLLLESGGNAEYCTELFQVLHRHVALHRAWNLCMERGLLPHTTSEPRQVAKIAKGFAVDETLIKALGILAKQESILRCDFNPGVELNVEEFVDTMRRLDGMRGLDGMKGFEEMRCFEGIEEDPSHTFHSTLASWSHGVLYRSFDLPPGRKYEDLLAENHELQTRDEYLQSIGMKCEEAPPS
ncbi:hypothetical protein FHETE_9139 [Fusarium heterosporum]|uniref:Uncharacterized protein n=1 Tax=Fusarium heterosporum TaxID=42747 RepID=A0A8H5T061_FUSHE|nr:hypothetical protein FHETE_9139 [Fusarium heterosporum]